MAAARLRYCVGHVGPFAAGGAARGASPRATTNPATDRLCHFLLAVEARPKMRARRRLAMKRLRSVIGLAGVRVVNAWFYGTPLDVFIQRTMLMILLVYLISGLQLCVRRRCRVVAARLARVAGRRTVRQSGVTRE
jgi:hypothetical protein